MEPRVVYVVDQNTTDRVQQRRTIEASLIQAGIPYKIMGFETAEEAAASFDGIGPPDLILCEKDSEEEGAGIRLLRHVRHTGNSRPFILWGKRITDDHRDICAQLDALCAQKTDQILRDFVCRNVVQLLRGQIPRPY